MPHFLKRFPYFRFHIVKITQGGVQYGAVFGFVNPFSRELLNDGFFQIYFLSKF